MDWNNSFMHQPDGEEFPHRIPSPDFKGKEIFDKAELAEMAQQGRNSAKSPTEKLIHEQNNQVLLELTMASIDLLNAVSTK